MRVNIPDQHINPSYFIQRKYHILFIYNICKCELCYEFGEFWHDVLRGFEFGDGNEGEILYFEEELLKNTRDGDGIMKDDL